MLRAGATGRAHPLAWELFCRDLGEEDARVGALERALPSDPFPGARRRDRQTLRRELLPTLVLPPTPMDRGCVHGCDGECALHSGPDECGLTCHFDEDEEALHVQVSATWVAS